MIHIPSVTRMVTSSGSANQYPAMKFNCEGTLNALAVNKDYSQVIVAGRTVFKILNIKDDCFEENTNLRLGKHRVANLTFCTADVAWHPTDENLLASAAFNGSVVIWNLNMAGKFKQDKILEKHDRAVTRVLFHETEQHQLLSASQDGVVMIHDIREEKSCMKFGLAGSESVRDAQFCPTGFGAFTFAAAYEDGSVKTWDLRWRDRCERQFMAHTGPVFSLDWHPTDKTWWLATAGRDKMINVWDMVRASSSTQPPCLFNIATIAPVAGIKWRPNRKHHISSCSMVVDHCVNVWDVNRPYIPFASFDGHLDVATSVVWREDCHAFLSCGKDGYIIQHHFNDARRPADNVNMAGLDLRLDGDIGYAFKELNTSSLGKSKKVSRSRLFTQASSGLCMFESLGEPQYDNVNSDDGCDGLMLHSFEAIAHHYRLEGASIVEMCRHNGNVAHWYKKHQVAQLWRILAATYTPCIGSQTSGTTPSTLAVLSNKISDKHDMSDLGSKPAVKKSKEKRRGRCQTDHYTSGSTDESSDHEGESSEVERSAPENTQINFLFGDGEAGEEELEDFAESTGILHPFDWSLQRLPVEAFEPRHEIKAIGQRPIDHSAALAISERVSMRMSEPAELYASEGDGSQHQESTLFVAHVHNPEPLDFSPSIAEMICSLAEQGDVQSAVSMLIVLGENIRPHIDEPFQECWFLSYIDLLSRFKLWTISNTVIKLCKLMGVCTLNQVSTVYHTQCDRCSRPCERAAWLCDKCKQVVTCSICHLPVKGLMAWCQGCGHGGHIEHIRQWMEFSFKCPAGCGHSCEFS